MQRGDKSAGSWLTELRRFLPAALLLVAVGRLLAAGPVSAAIDPFYTEALREGASAFEQGDYARAVGRLRIAVFGMLDEPQALARGLVRLALAQAALNDREAFLETFDRVSEVEERFHSYSNGGLPPSLQAAFERRITELVPSAVLRASTAFGEHIRAQELQLLQSLPPARAQAELERIVSENPDDPQWRSMLARAQVVNGNGGKAIDVLEQEILADADNAETGCLLGRAYLQSRRCESALVRVPSCNLLTLPKTEQIDYIDCLTADGRWSEAAAVVVSLPSEIRTSRQVAKREKRIARALPVEVRVEPVAAPPQPAPRPAEPTENVAQPAPVPVQPRAVPLRALTQLRERLDRAMTVTALLGVANDAEGLASRYPDSREPLRLAGEAAYRASSWARAAALLQAAGGPSEDRPDLLFYLSVSLYESGRPSEAASVLRRAQPNLVRTPIVERYLNSILGGGP